MNFAQLKARTIQLCKLEGCTDVSPSPNWDTLVNQALEEFSWEAEYVASNVTLTLIAGVSEYTLPINGQGAWKRVTDAVLGTGKLLLLTDENTLRRQDPLWIVAPQAQPSRFWLPSPNTVQFFPIPDSDGDVVTLRGFRADTPLTLETDTPTCPSHYHEGICLLAAWKHGKLYAQAEALPRVNAYRAEANTVMEQLGMFLAEQEAPIFQRRVRREIAERVPHGWMRWIP